MKFRTGFLFLFLLFFFSGMLPAQVPPWPMESDPARMVKGETVSKAELQAKKYHLASKRTTYSYRPRIPNDSFPPHVQRTEIMYFNKAGNVVRDSTYDGITYYLYNNKGFLSEIKKDTQIVSKLYYDSPGRLVKTVSFDEHNNPAGFIFFYYDNGKLIQRIDSGEFDYRRYTYTYDTKNRISAIRQDYEMDSHIEYYMIFRYNDSGIYVNDSSNESYIGGHYWKFDKKWNELENAEDKQSHAKRIYSYDTQGNATSFTWYDGIPGKETSGRAEYDYDEHGLLMESRFFTTQGPHDVGVTDFFYTFYK
jgi:hypothetical protein